MKAQLPYSPATPKSKARMRAAAMVDDASGMVVTSDTSRMPTVPEDMPVIVAMLSALTLRK